MIRAAHLTKHFKVHKRPPGFAAAVRSLVRRRYEVVKAVDDVSFTIQRDICIQFLTSAVGRGASALGCEDMRQLYLKCLTESLSVAADKWLKLRA